MNKYYGMSTKDNKKSSSKLLYSGNLGLLLRLLEVTALCHHLLLLLLLLPSSLFLFLLADKNELLLFALQLLILLGLLQGGKFNAIAFGNDGWSPSFFLSCPARLLSFLLHLFLIGSADGGEFYAVSGVLSIHCRSSPCTLFERWLFTFGDFFVEPTSSDRFLCCKLLFLGLGLFHFQLLSSLLDRLEISVRVVQIRILEGLGSTFGSRNAISKATVTHTSARVTLTKNYLLIGLLHF